ncbi:MAG: hypothetical protein U5K71_17035 [Gracilimonas sp.]|nr:hypothetical protein [Gracilimonas sp.]
MNSDKDITALFIKRDYPLTVNVDGGGSVQEEVVQSKTTDYEHGTDAKKQLGDIFSIREMFVGFQEWLYRDITG